MLVAPSGVTRQGALRGNEQALLPRHPPCATVPASPPATESFCAVRRSLRELEEFMGPRLMRPGERPALPRGRAAPCAGGTVTVRLPLTVCRYGSRKSVTLLTWADTAAHPPAARVVSQQVAGSRGAGAGCSQPGETRSGRAKTARWERCHRAEGIVHLGCALPPFCGDSPRIGAGREHRRSVCVRVLFALWGRARLYLHADLETRAASGRLSAFLLCAALLRAFNASGKIRPPQTEQRRHGSLPCSWMPPQWEVGSFGAPMSAHPLPPHSRSGVRALAVAPGG